MKYIQVPTINYDLDLILPFRKNAVDTNQIEKITGIKNIDFEGDFAKCQMLYSNSGRRIYLLGLGEEKDAVKLKDAFRKITFYNKKYWSDIQLDCSNLNFEEIKQAAIGIQMATYNLGVFKSNLNEGIEAKKDTTISFVALGDIMGFIKEGEQSGDTINSIKTLIDAPANQKTPEFLGKWAQDSAKKYNYNCEVWNKSKLEKEGFGALLAVGQGSINEPCLIVVSHKPKKTDQIDLGLVGKGITFDTGGLSIKPSANLHYMKSDMGGAAAVLGAVELAAKLKLEINVVGIIAAAENAVDANSIRPGDVIHSHSGKTIEIIDTDAEGRLVLADGLSHMVNTYNPDHMIDLATLTGSVVRTLGYSAGGMFTTNNELADSLSKVGASIHERLWHLPLYDDFDEDIQSDIADLRNFSGKPIAGAITAAKFLEAFTEEHEKWAHLDIAGVAFGSSEYAKMKCASGYGVRLLVEFMKTLI